VFEAGPTLQEVAEQYCVAVLKPIQRLREVLFQGAAQSIGDAGLVANEVASLLDQRGQGSYIGALRLQRPQLLPVMQQQLEGDFSIGRVILGAAGDERLAVLGQCGWIHRKQNDERVTLQGMHQWTFGDLQAYRNRAPETAVQASRPPRDRLGSVRQHAKLTLRRASGLQTEIVLSVGPVNPDQGCESLFGRKLHRSPPRAVHCRKGHACSGPAKPI
jgi:hypothetical protein